MKTIRVHRTGQLAEVWRVAEVPRQGEYLLDMARAQTKPDEAGVRVMVPKYRVAQVAHHANTPGDEERDVRVSLELVGHVEIL